MITAQDFILLWWLRMGWLLLKLWAADYNSEMERRLGWEDQWEQ